MKDLWRKISADRNRLLLGAAALVWLAAAAAAVVTLRGRTVDDFYITYRYAANLVRGHGFVFNPGERVFGVSDPGLGLAAALLHRLTRAPIEWLASALFGAALLGIPLLLLREGMAAGRRLETLLGGSLTVISSVLWRNNSAAGPMTLVALLGAAAVADRRPWTAGILAGIAVWIRPDAGIGVVLLLLLLLFEKKSVPWGTALAAAAVVAAGLLCAWVWFDSILPGTLAAKVEMAQGSGEPATGIVGFWRRGSILLERHFGPAWLLLVAAGVIGQWPLARMGRLGRLTSLYGVSLAIFYPAVGAPFCSWYTLVPVIALLYGVSFCGPGIARAIASSPKVPHPWASLLQVAGAVAVLLLASDALRASWRLYTRFSPSERLVTYERAAAWLRESSRSDDTVAYVEIGVLGYYSRRPLEDLMGLVTPRVLPYLAHRDIAGAFLTKPTDYVLFHSRGMMRPVVKAPWFRRAYEEVASFQDSGFRGGRLVIFRRRDGAHLPPPHPPGERPGWSRRKRRAT